MKNHNNFFRSFIGQAIHLDVPRAMNSGIIYTSGPVELNNEYILEALLVAPSSPSENMWKTTI